MSHDDNVPAERDHRAAVRVKARQVKAAQTRARVLRTSSVVVLLAAVVAAVAVVITWTVTSTLAKPVLKPGNIVDGGILVESSGATTMTNVASGTFVVATPPAPAAEGEATATPTETESAAPTENPTPVEVRVYVDYLSEGAKQFQVANAKQLSAWVASGNVTLSYHPVAILTAKSNGTKYSLRAASASACVATHAPETFFAFNYEILAKQPEIDTDGYSNVQLADMAIAVGAPDPKVIRSCIEQEDFLSWAKSATERALNEPLPGSSEALTGSPTVLVNGVQYVGALDNPSEFENAVLSAAYKSFNETPEPEPTETATPEATPTATPEATPSATPSETPEG